MKRTNAAALSLSIGLALASCGKPADGTGAAGSRPPVAVETAKAATTGACGTSRATKPGICASLSK